MFCKNDVILRICCSCPMRRHRFRLFYRLCRVSFSLSLLQVGIYAGDRPGRLSENAPWTVGEQPETGAGAGARSGGGLCNELHLTDDRELSREMMWPPPPSTDSTRPAGGPRQTGRQTDTDRLTAPGQPADRDRREVRPPTDRLTD